MPFYTFRPPAPTVRTGTADAERWSGRPRMVCGKGVRVPLGIGSRIRPSGEHRAAAARGRRRLSGRKSSFGALAGLQTATDADRDVSYGERGIADRMNVPLGIGSRSVRLRSGAALAGKACESALGPPVSCDAFDRFGRVATSRSQDSDRSAVMHA